MNYKDKYILFYLEGKKALSEKRVSRILGISYPDDMPDGYHGQDIIDIANDLKNQYQDTLLNQSLDYFKEIGIKKEMDKIQFEYRYEVQELMKVIDKYVKQNPSEKENKTLERFFDLLDVMDMEW